MCPYFVCPVNTFIICAGDGLEALLSGRVPLADVKTPYDLELDSLAVYRDGLYLLRK